MKFTTGTKEITGSTFTVLREKNCSLLDDYNVVEGGVFDNKQYFQKVPAKKIKVGETVYKNNEVYGYRCS